MGVQSVCLTCSLHFGEVVLLTDALDGDLPEWSEFHHTEPGHLVVGGYEQ